VEKIGDIVIRIQGQKGNMNLSPDNYDIREIISTLETVEALLFPNQKKERPVISYGLEEGSVKHVFKTSMQAVLGFTAILGQINENNSIDFLELKSAQAIEAIQNSAYQKNYSFEISTSVSEGVLLKVDSKSRFLKTETIWADAEFYFYGTLTNAGGKSNPNIHLDTPEYGSLTISTQKEVLRNKEENMLYKKFGARVTGKQNSETGEFDKSSLELLELFDFEPKFDKEYLLSKIKKAKNNWSGVDKTKWLKDLRGGYDA
tara:strand:- start:2453 stop:3232 length:780 start_codon:yes stop_codon:yes gene_type:complete